MDDARGWLWPKCIKSTFVFVLVFVVVFVLVCRKNTSKLSQVGDARGWLWPIT